MKNQILVVTSFFIIGLTLLNPLSNFAQNQPNIILMLTDDQSYGDIGAHGNPYLKTPHIESIGAEGLEMTHFLLTLTVLPHELLF